MSSHDPFAILHSVAAKDFAESPLPEEEGPYFKALVDKILGEVHRIHTAEVERLALGKMTVQALKLDHQSEMTKLQDHLGREIEKRDAIIRHLEQLILAGLRANK